MLKGEEKLVQDYLFKTSIGYTGQDLTCYAFGFIDGYLREKMFLDYVLESTKEEYLAIYNDGIHKGSKYDISKKEKDNYIKKLAAFDMMNKMVERKLSPDAKAVYDDCLKYGINIPISNPDKMIIDKPKKR